MPSAPLFSRTGWDFVVFLSTYSLGLVCFFFHPALALLCCVLGMALLFLRQRNGDRHNARHDLEQRIPAGSKFNYTFFLILLFNSVWLLVWIFLRPS